MNSEELIRQAGVAIDEWQKKHNTDCLLYIKEGEVHCRQASDYNRRKVFDLYVSCWYQEHGFTSAQWNIIGTALFNKYTKELSCQERQKP